MANFPSVITSFTNPLSTDRLNSPSHSAIETAQNSGLTQVQTFLGVEGASSTLGTLIYDVRSPGSNGGGHIQTANKGGTGQTSYNQGDLLVAQSTSVLSKLALGADGQILSANSSVATGVQWIANSRAKISASASVITLIGNTNETSVLTTTIPGSTLGTSNVIRATAYVTNWNPRGNLTVNALYGGGVVASVVLTLPGTTNSSFDSAEAMAGQIGYTLIANNSVNSQRVFLSVQMNGRSGISSQSSSIYSVTNSQVASIASDASQVLGLTFREAVQGDGLIMGGTIVEKIN